MFIAIGLCLAAVPMFLVSRGLIISLSQISGRYMETTDEVMRAAYLASAELALGTQNIYATMALTLLCIASVIMGLVTLRVPIAIPFIGLVLAAVWQLVVGARLYNLGRGS